jgi:hypothetical protein
MADKKISALTTAASPLAGTEVLPIVQSGATVKVSVADLTQTQNNVAVATTKMAWTGPGHLDVPNDGGLFSKGVYNNIGSNWYYDNALRYNVTGAAGWYQQNSGFHVWYSAASGTAGSPIASFPETMALFPNGDLKLASGNFVPSAAGKGIDFSAATHAAGMTSELLNDYEEGVWTGTLTGDAAAPTTPVTASGRYTRIGRQVTAQISLFNVNTTGASGVLLITGLPFSSSAERAYGSCFFIGMGSAVATAHIQSADNRISFLDAVTGAYINISAGAGKYVGASITYTV